MRYSTNYGDNAQSGPVRVGKKTVFAIIGAVLLLFLIWAFCSVVEDTDKSKNYVCQFPITGTYEVWTTGGLQWPWFGNVQEYQKTSQIEFTGVEREDGGSLTASREKPAALVTFSDKGKGYIVGSFRVEMPLDDEHMKKIQQDFGSEEALIQNLVRPTLYKVVTACGPLMTSLQSVSETRTDLTNYITDQLNNGIYKTKNIKVQQRNDITGEMEIVTMSEIILDSLAPEGFKRQEISPFSKYGVRAGIVSIIDIVYDKTTQDQIDAQKGANLAVITAKTKAIEAQQKAILIEEQGKAKAAEAKWNQEKEKAVAVTKAEQEREVSRLAAEKAEFDKKKVIAQGEAEAAANRAKVSAGLTPQERAEWEYKTKVGVAEALANIALPKVVMTGGNAGSGNTAMDAMGLKMMTDLVDKMSK